MTSRNHLPCKCCRVRRANRAGSLCHHCYHAPSFPAPLDTPCTGQGLNHDADGGHGWYVVATDQRGRRTIISGHGTEQQACSEAHVLARGGIDYQRLTVEQHGRPPVLILVPEGAAAAP